MDFGKVTEQELDHIDFRLPKDTALTQQSLSKRKGNTKFYIGCAKWSRNDWVGKIYPPKTKAGDFLEHYAKSFSCVEMNAMYHNTHPAKTIELWKSKVGKDFKFVPKFTQDITHELKLKNTSKQVAHFLERMSAFGENLGPIFLMPSPYMTPKDMDTILNFIDELPKDIELFVEVRNKAWFEESTHPLFHQLAERNVGSIITDAAGRRDVVHMNLTTPKCFIRFVGNSLHESDYIRIDNWIDRIHEWCNQGIEEVYFFMHHHDELYSPDLIKYMIEELNRRYQLNIQVPIFYSDKKKDEWTLF
jgi:uncharacterized protein YecE (DUF72 family)